MKILLLGKNGQIGFELQKYVGALGDILAPSRIECDLINISRLKNMIRAITPDVIINAAAYTDVDKAELEPDLAYEVNARALAALSEEAKQINALIVHYSTDYIFDGQKSIPYTEQDTPAPQNVYGQTKLEGEQHILKSGAPYLIFRTSWVISERGNNFIRTLLQLVNEKSHLHIVSDQFGAPTAAAFIAATTIQAIKAFYQKRLSCGVYHLAAKGETSRFDWACYVIKWLNNNHFLQQSYPIYPIHTSAYPSLAKRPLNSCLNTSLLEYKLSMIFPEWYKNVDIVMMRLMEQSNYTKSFLNNKIN